MEEKQAIVIQGRTIERERPTERAHSYQNRYNYSSQADVSSESRNLESQDSIASYNLSKLREMRNSLQPTRSSQSFPRLKPRPGLRPSGFSTGRTSGSRMSASGPRSRRRGMEEDVPKHNSLMIKIGVSVVLALIIFLLHSIPLPFTQGVVDQVRTALTEDFDVDEALGKLKFVGDTLPDQIKSVFQQDSTGDPTSASFASPVQGEVIHSFGEQLVQKDNGKVYVNQGIDIKTAEDAIIHASADGNVAAIEEHETYGRSIWLEHGNRIFTFYGGCSQVDVKIGQKVNIGMEMGKVQTTSEGEPTLHFQIWIDDKPADPLKHITQASQVSEGQGV